MTCQVKFRTSEESSQAHIFRKLTIRKLSEYTIFIDFEQVFQKLWQYK